jgi:hypothetical protein
VIGSLRSSEWTSHCKEKKQEKRKTMCTHFSKNPLSELLESMKFTTKKTTTNWRDRKKLYNNNLKNLHNKSKQLPMDGV